ncbi:transposase [Methylobacter sp. sgz302048]|uniref:transposase n=1 Tax=Methylobacter sp. sgz302048 TaxID=3455945 RepID=UPI003FA03361
MKPGDSVICDSLSAHKVAKVQAIVAAHGATIKYLSPYSPDLNPIEQVFAKLKALLRKAAERTYDKLWQLIGKLLGKFQADECLNLFRHSGYVST